MAAALSTPTMLRPTSTAVTRMSPNPDFTESTTVAGDLIESATPPTNSSRAVGSRAGRHTSVPMARGSGVTSKITWPMSTAAMPSTIAWWLLLRIAKRPPSRPSIRYISHNGRFWSSGRLMMRATRSRNCASVPGRGKAERRTW